MGNPVTNVAREIEQIAARLLAERQPTKPKVYPVESMIDPYGFFHNDCIWEYPAKAEPMPMDRTCAGWERGL